MITNVIIYSNGGAVIKVLVWEFDIRRTHPMNGMINRIGGSRVRASHQDNCSSIQDECWKTLNQMILGVTIILFRKFIFPITYSLIKSSINF